MLKFFFGCIEVDNTGDVGLLEINSQVDAIVGTNTPLFLCFFVPVAPDTISRFVSGLYQLPYIVMGYICPGNFLTFDE